MTDEKLFRERLRKLVESQSLAVLSTCRQGGAYSSLIGFIVTDDLSRIVFATLRGTRKYTNIQDNENVSVLIDSRSNRIDDFREAVAVTAVGTAGEVTGQERDVLAKLYLKRHYYLKDFIGDPNCAIMTVQVHRYILVSQFQQVIEMEMKS
jgi:nitroimidazol reductase NimA-like FMN-containing flavoprotein (pyridoxamine 5'-phosphate oxidase superfamily)